MLKVIINSWVRPSMMEAETHGHLFRFGSCPRATVATASLHLLRHSTCRWRRPASPVRRVRVAVSSRALGARAADPAVFLFGDCGASRGPGTADEFSPRLATLHGLPTLGWLRWPRRRPGR